MIVCICHRVSDRDITAAVRDGTNCFDMLQDDTGVATGCGCCHDCARQVFDAACAKFGTVDAAVTAAAVRAPAQKVFAIHADRA